MDYREIIESRYNRKNWQELLFDIFRNKAQFWQQPQRVPVDESMAKLAYYTGKITLPDGHTIAIYEVELSDNVIIERNRAGIRNLLCTNWRGMGCSGAFMFCFRQQEAVLRFSYVSEAFTFAEDGSLKKDSTDTKRFTYLLGEGHRSRTAIQQFEKLKASGLTLKDITKAFSVEALSDLFFKEYKKQYEDIIEFVTGKRMVKVANKWEERVTGEPCREIMQEFAQFPDAEKAVRDYVKKLMGRLVFIQFLQKKGWMGCSAGEAWNDGDREFVQNLFANTTHKNTFVDDVLEPLFNDINTRRTNDIANAALGAGIKVPYLNGGLFEHDDYDKTNFPLPAKYMKSLLDFFASYNFTIDENDPDDAEIGVDPEMLGRIFENLLEDNKDKGAFYTPKEIVQYMCRESLIAYLQTDEEDEAVKLQIREFVTTNNADILSADLAASIDQKLKDVKICDPAIGSGAFPMGLLRELYACRKAIEGIDNDNAVRIKTHIIQNNIYGVDIEKGAVDIARLRFWLALIVDEKTPHALPNMDFKIMQGNSLLEQYEGVELSGMSLNEQEKRRSRKKKEQAWQQTLAFDEEASLDNIQNAIREYYGTDDHRQKTELRNIINSNVKSYILNLKGCTPDIQRKLENLPIPNDQFFLWHIYFKEVFDKGGFDIVIGNPPYVRVQNLDYELIDILKKNYKTALKRIDISLCFIELSKHLLNPKGNCTFITSNQFLTTEYGKSMREFLLSEFFIESCIDLGDLPVFESAMTYVSIFRFSKHNNYGLKYYPVEDMESVKHMNYGDPKFVEYSSLSSDNWNLKGNELSAIYDKMFRCSILLSEIGHCNAGLITGCDSILMFSSKDLPKITFEKEILLPVLRADNCSKYHATNPTKFVIYPYCTENGKTRLLSEEELKNTYPIAYSYLLSHKDVLYNRKDSRSTMGEKGLWYGLVRFGRKEMFDQPKIISPGEVQSHKFCIDYSKGGFSCARVFAITIEKATFDIKYVLALMNSTLMKSYIQSIASLKSGGYYSYSSNILNRCPIANANENQYSEIVSLVDEISQKKQLNPQADTTAEEREIDRLVYDLYGLTEDEIKIVEGTNR